MSSLLPLLSSPPASNLLRPSVTVQIAFNAGYSTPAEDRVWTDVSEYVRIIDGIDITHGRGDERSQADANTCRLVLNNSDGRFTPELSTSPYYPNVKIGRHLRVSVMTLAGHTSVRFVGYIDEWPLEWPAVVDTFAVSAITATSRIARLGSSAPLGNHIYEEYRRDTLSPTRHYMLDNLSDSVSGGRSLVQAGSGAAVTFEGTGPTDGISAAQFTGGKYLKDAVLDFWRAVITFTIATTANNVAIMGWRTTPDEYIFEDWDLRVTAAGKIEILKNGVAQATSTASVNDGNTHHVVWWRHQSGSSDEGIYIDGTLDTSYDMGVLWGGIGGAMEFRLGQDFTGGTGFTGTLAHYAEFTSGNTAWITRWSNACLNGFTGDDAEDRLHRYMEWANIPSGEVLVPTLTTPMAHIDSTGQTALALMQKVAETDGGVLYDWRSGILAYNARTSRYNAATAITLDASAGQVSAAYAPKLDRSSLINEVVATIADGSDPQETVTARNQTSYDDYGPYREDIELATTDADEAHAAAWWRVNTYGTPRARAPQLGVEIAHLSTAMQASVLALDVGSKVVVSNLPSQSDASSKSFFVEGYAERIGAEVHEFEFNVSPTTGFDVWILDDTTYSVLDSTTKLAY